MNTRFVWIYPGNARPTGHICLEHHEYVPADEPGRASTWESPTCWHNATDGYATEASLEEIERVFLREEHSELGHRVPVAGCPWCEPRRSPRIAAATWDAWYNPAEMGW